MDIPKIYNPALTEDKWYNYWIEKKFFKSTPDGRKPYTVVIPPPNVTGVLHMGHMLNNTIQDVLVRRARMKGFNACWVPGTDHASIATEAKVVALLKQKGIDKKNISREEFIQHAWKWKEKHGGIILEQLKKLGASCDWDRTRFTMDEDLSEGVIDVFIDLYKKGLIYRGVRMVNWDPSALTALSDEEVIYKEVNSKLFFIKYIFVKGSEDGNRKMGEPTGLNPDSPSPISDYITVATTRPETILGDTAICVNPNDSRYKHLRGKKVFVPLINREIPIIFDDYVAMEFGTGALKVTPAHDLNDYQLGVKHNLPVIDIFNENGTINKNGILFTGEDRFSVRKKIAKELELKGYLEKTDDMVNKVGYSERTDAVIEPKLSVQWFCKMKNLSKPALDNVIDDTIRFYPSKFKNTYRHWMENIKDWCISRQLWWGQRIPAWYCSCTECSKVVMIQKNKPEKCVNCGCTEEIFQDEDVLDTWFSSWLWPVSVFDPTFFGGKSKTGNEDLQYYYPTNDLVTAPEIMFFWVARMIICGYEYMGKPPFKNVYYTGIVRDKIGRKMSKSLGNSPDPLDLIQKYGADGVRVGMLLCSPAGNDLPFDESLCEQGRNFANKIWNAFRLVNGFNVDEIKIQPEENKIAIEWFRAKLNSELKIIEKLFEEFRISEALMAIYKLIWDDFCAWYLEMIKPEFTDGKPLPVDKLTFDSTIGLFENLLKIIHPFMPFITEEIWHLIRERNESGSIMIANFPKNESFDNQILKTFSSLFGCVVSIRSIRNEKNISPKIPLILFIKSDETGELKKTELLIKKLCNLSSVNFTKTKVDSAVSFVVEQTEFFVSIPDGIVDAAGEKEKLLKDLEYHRGFLNSVTKKLANEKFVANAKPEILFMEKKKLADAEAKIKALEEQLKG